MWTFEYRSLGSALLTVALGLAAVSVALDVEGPSRFLVERKLAQAVARGDGCVAYTGDSRMVMGVLPSLLQDELKRLGSQVPCVSDLSIVGTTSVEHWLAVREYLRSGRRPSWVVVGVTVDDVLSSALTDPSELVGNRSVTLTWSDTSDVFALYPALSIESFDRAVRFSLLRSQPIGRYVSLGWVKVQPLQNAAMGVPAWDPGRRDDPDEISQQHAHWEREASAILAGWKETDRFSPGFEQLLRLLRAEGIPLLAVSVPMPPGYRKKVDEHPRAQRFRAELSRRLRPSGYLRDLCTMPLGPEDFQDAAHLGERGARAFTTEIAKAIALADQRPCSTRSD
jgi:hypothetical protein